MEQDLNIVMMFGIKDKWIIFTHTMYFWLIIAVLLMTAFVLQGYILLVLLILIKHILMDYSP